MSWGLHGGACDLYNRTQLLALHSVHVGMLLCVLQHLNRWCEQTAAEGATVKAADECKTMTFDFIINVIIGRDLSESELASLIDTYKVSHSMTLA
jgi:hypothetical protein